MCVCSCVQLCMGMWVCMRASMHRHVSVCVCVWGDLLCVFWGGGDLLFPLRQISLTCDPSPRRVLLCACYGDHFILCVCYVFVSGLPYSAYLMDSTSHHGVIGQPTTKIPVDVLTETTVASCVVVESSILYMKLYYSIVLSCMISFYR